MEAFRIEAAEIDPLNDELMVFYGVLSAIDTNRQQHPRSIRLARDRKLCMQHIQNLANGTFPYVPEDMAAMVDYESMMGDILYRYYPETYERRSAQVAAIMESIW